MSNEVTNPYITIQKLVGHYLRQYDMTHEQAVKHIRECVTSVARDYKAYMGRGRHEEAFNLCRTSDKCPKCTQLGVRRVSR